MGRPLRLLVVEDVPDDAKLVILALRKGGLEPLWERVETAEEFRAALAAGEWDAVLSDYRLPQFGAREALEIVRAFDPNLPFFVVSGTIGEEAAVGVMRAGANDYILKGNLTRLAPALDRELREAENRRARRAAEWQAQQLAAIVNSSDDAIFSTDLDGRILFWNPAAERLFGYSRADAVGMSAFDLVPPDLLAETGERIGRVRRGEHVPPVETVRLRRGGEPVHVSVASSTVWDGDRVTGMAGIWRDVTEKKRAEAVLQEERSKLADAVGLARLGYWHRDLATDELDWSDLQYEIFGLDAEAVGHTYETFLAAVHPEDRAAVGERIAEAVASVGTFDHSYRISVRGEVRVIHEVGRVFAGEDGTALRVEGTAQDVTERARAERDLRLFRALIDRTTDAIEVIDPGTGRFLDVNEKACAAHGYTREEYLRLGVADVDPRVAAATWEALRAAGRLDGVQMFESLHRRKDGSTFPVEVNFNTIRLDRDYMVAVVRDIGDRKRTEDALRESEEGFRAFMDNSPAAAFIKDEAGRYLYVNATWLGQFDPPPADWRGRTDYDYWPRETADRFRDSDAECLARNAVMQSEESGRTPAGEDLTWLVMKFPLVEGGRRRLGGMAWDVSDRKRAERVRAERVRLASLVGDVGVALSREESLRDSLRRCAEALVRHLDAAFARVWTLSADGAVLELQASAGMYTHLDGPHARVPVGQFKIGLIAHERRPHATNAVCDDPRVGDHAWARREGMVAFAGFPLLSEDRLVGVVAMFARAPITDLTLEGLGAAANQIALGINRKRAEESFRASEERIRLLLDSAVEAIYGIDLDGLCTFCNAACARLLGYADPGNLIGRNMHAVIHHTRADGSAYPVEECRIYLAFRQGSGTHADDEVFWRADGTSFPAEYWSNPIRDAARVVGAVVTFLDITERKLSAEALRSSRERLQHVLSSSPAVLFTLEVTHGQIGEINWISDNIRGMLGYAPEEATAPDWWMGNVHPDNRDDVVGQFLGTIFERGHTTHEYRFRHKDGHYRWTRGELRLVSDAVGRPVEVVGSWSDITDRKLLEEQFRQAQKMEAVGQLAGGVAHDFNNLLTIISGYSELLLDRLPAADPSREFVAQIHDAGARSAGLTRQLLAFSRQQVLDPKVLDLNAVVAEAEKLLRRLIGEDLCLTTALDPALLPVKADAGQLEQVLMNLAVNARDAMPRGGRLTIATQNVDLDEAYTRTHRGARAGPQVLLSVADTGKGMPPEVLARVFEPFYTTKGPGKGTGLGLATVYGIVEQSGGHIAVYSEVGVGTTFKVYLPPTARASRELKLKPAARTAPRGTETVLLVEDENRVRALTRRILAESGYTVIEAADGTEAVRLAEAHGGPIHLLVTDVVLPEVGGRVVAERVAAKFPGVKVLFVSGYTDDAVIRHGVLVEGVHFLQKPFSPAALAFKVREVLDAPAKRG